MWVSIKARDKVRKNPTWLLGILLFLHLVAISLNRVPEAPEMWFIQKIFISISHPAQSFMANSAAWINNGWDYYLSLRDSRQENQRLKEELNSRHVRVLELEEKLKSFDRIKALTEFQDIYKYKAVQSRVIARDASELFSTVVIDKGSTSGIQKDQPVIADGGLVGRVIFAAPFASRVLLITDERHAGGAIITQTQGSRLLGILKGRNDQLCELRFIDTPGRVSNGEEVITSGQDGVYPKGLLIGRIKMDGLDSSIVPSEVIVEPTAPLKSLELVAVLDIPPDMIRYVEEKIVSEEQKQDSSSDRNRRPNRR